MAPARTIFTKDDSKTRSFASYEEGKAALAALGPDTELTRTRLRFRSRTGQWDLVLKFRKEVAE